MPLVSEKKHIDKLKKYHINIITKYIVGNDIITKDIEKIDKDILSGTRCQKEYYIKEKLIHQENLFDSRIEYTYLNNHDEKEYTCDNCGMKGKINDFINGCPYCGTTYNIDYNEKDLGSKYHYDLVLRKNNYRYITGIIDVIISLILAYIFIKNTSRTFNNIDIIKIFIYGGILSMILYYFFYLIDAYFILAPIKNYKKRLNQKQINFWNRTQIDKKKFYNNLNYELEKKYYQDEKIIDYDILDYDDFNDYERNNTLYVKVKLYVRLVLLINNKISIKYQEDEITLKHNNLNTLELQKGKNLIRCNNCGSSIDITKDVCEYCGTKQIYLQEWIKTDD